MERIPQKIGENLQPLQDLKNLSPTTKFKISSNGDIEVEGKMDEEAKEIITTALQQAEFYRQKAAQLEQEKIKKSSEVDAVVVVFISSLLAVTMLLSYMVVSAVSSKFTKQSSITVIIKGV